MIPILPLEDTFADVISKAMRGWTLSDTCVAERCGLIAADVVALRTGKWSESTARKVAPILGLDSDCLVALAGDRTHPPSITVPNVESFFAPFGDMLVNSYLVWDSRSNLAAAFDTGSDCSEMLDFLEKHSLRLHTLFLTHTHGDHVFEMDRLLEKTGARVLVNEREPFGGAEAFSPGQTWDVGGIHIESRSTWGHSKGGTTYYVPNLQIPVAIVGDALFASSMGGGMVSFPDALRTNREEILTLPGRTVLCPGHGPLTTVEWELSHNPFFGPKSR